MKKFNEVIQEVEKTTVELKKQRDLYEKTTDKYLNINDIKDRAAARKKYEPMLCNISDNILNLELTIKILKNNAKIALYNEVVPVIIEVLEKYKNKPYGEKTRVKISDLVKEKIGCRMYITTRYSTQEINIYPDYGYNEYNITIGSKIIDGNYIQLLVDNKIQVPEIDNLKLWYERDNYINNIPDHIETLKAAYNTAYQLQVELNEACKMFNDLAVGDIEHIRVDNRINNRFRG